MGRLAATTAGVSKLMGMGFGEARQEMAPPYNPANDPLEGHMLKMPMFLTQFHLQ